MGFQIAYAIRFINKYSKVADDFLKKVRMIDAKVLGGAKNFGRFEKAGVQGMSKVGKSVEAAERRMESFTRQTKKQTSAMRAMNATAGRFRSRMASRAITGALAGFGLVKATQSAMDFQDVMREMQALTGAEGKELEFLTRKAWEFGKVFGKSGADAMTGIKRVGDEFPQLLKNIPGLAKMTKEVTVLSVASGMTMPNSVKALVASLEIFRKDASQAREVINMLAAGALHSSSMIEQTAESIVRGGAAAQSVGMSMQRYLALTNALAKSQIKGAKAGTALNTVITRLAIRGINLGDGTKSVTEIIGKLRAKMESLGEVERQLYIKDLFGLHHRKSGMALITHFKELDKWESKVQGTNEAYNQADIRLKTLRVEFAKTGAVMNEKFWKVFQYMEVPLTRLIVSFREWVDSMSADELRGYALLLGTVVDLLRILLELTKILLAPFRAIAVVIGFIENRWDELGKKLSDKYQLGWEFGANHGAGLELKLAGMEMDMAPGAKGRVQVDVNVNGSPGAVKSASAKSEGDVDFNMGINFAY